MVANLIFHKRTKYVRINYHFIRDEIVRGFVTTKHVSTNMQLADILTKAFDRNEFAAFLIKLKIRNIHSLTVERLLRYVHIYINYNWICISTF